MLPGAGTRIPCLLRLREQEKTNAEEYTDGRSGDDPDGEEVEEDTDRKNPRSAARCRCSSHQGRQQRLAPSIGEHARRCVELIGKVRWIRRVPRCEIALRAAIWR